MRNYRNFAAALALALVFSTAAFADDGIIHTEKTPPPPPPPSATGVMTTGLTDDIINTDIAAPAPTTTNSVTEIASILLQGALALF